MNISRFFHGLSCFFFVWNRTTFSVQVHFLTIFFIFAILLIFRFFFKNYFLSYPFLRIISFCFFLFSNLFWQFLSCRFFGFCPILSLGYFFLIIFFLAKFLSWQICFLGKSFSLGNIFFLSLCRIFPVQLMLSFR